MATEIMRASYTSSATPTPATCVTDRWSERVWPWRGCILSSPALAGNPNDATPIMISLGQFFSKVLPKMQLTGLSVDGISRVPAVVTQYENDILNWHGTMRARWGMEMFGQ